MTTVFGRSDICFECRLLVAGSARDETHFLEQQFYISTPEAVSPEGTTQRATPFHPSRLRFETKGCGIISDEKTTGHTISKAEIAQLSEQVKMLINERVAPALSQAPDTARQYAGDAREMYGKQAEALSEQVRQSAGPAILVAATVGYILGRIAR